MPPKGADEVSPRSGVNALFVSDGDSFAPRRERFLCLRRPHFFQQRKKWGKERRQKLRFCTSSARYARQRFPASSRGHNRSSPLSVKRTACTFTGAEASAAACLSHGRCFSLLPPQRQGLFRARARERVSDGSLLSTATKVTKSAGRNYVSALPQRAMADSDFPHLLAGITFHHRCQSKGLCLRSPARRLTRPLAPATVGVFLSYRHPQKPSPLMGRGVE
jgi:hypothetical protein